MAKNYVQVEILLITGTRFLAGNLTDKDGNPANSGFSETEQLQDACWNGLVQEKLPELVVKPANGGILYIWDIKEAESLLELELGEVPIPVDQRESISPRCFIGFLNYN